MLLRSNYSGLQLGLIRFDFVPKRKEALGNTARRTGLPIGVFGARKTRSAAVLLASLLVFDPSLKLFFFELCCARHYNCGSH